MTTKIDMTLTRSGSKSRAGRILWVAPLAMVISAGANLGLYAAAGRLLPAVTGWPGAGVGQIIGATCAYLFVGAIVFALVARVSTRPARHYVAIATAGMLLSLGLPLGAGFGFGAPGAPPAGTATMVTLSLMHVIAYAISVPMFVRLALD